MAEELSVKSILNKWNKKFDTTVVQYGVPKTREYGYLSLGSPGLDWCTYMSLTEAKFIEFAGLESSGKTTTACLVANAYKKEEVKRNPENPRKILFVDAECALDPEWIKKSTGYDLNEGIVDGKEYDINYETGAKIVKTIYISGAGQTAEEYFDMVIELMKTGEIGLIIFDSLSMIVGQQVMDESMEKKQMGGISSVLGDFCKRAVGLMNRYRTTFIGINGLSQNITGYGDPLLTSGGKGWKRACMLRVRFARGDFFDKDDNVIAKKDAQSPAGHIIEMYVEKTKVCPWDRKLGYLHLNYSKGVDILWDTIEVATTCGLVESPSQGWFVITDPETGETKLDAEGKPIKIRGKANLKPYFQEHLDEWRSLYDKVYEKIKLKDDPNCVAFEKMLSADYLEEHFKVSEIENVEEE